MTTPPLHYRTRTGADADVLLAFYWQACTDAGVVPLPDDSALQLLAMVLACLEPDSDGPLH